MSSGATEKARSFGPGSGLIAPPAATRSAVKAFIGCAQECAQTRSRNHHSATNGNQGPNKKRA